MIIVRNSTLILIDTFTLHNLTSYKLLTQYKQLVMTSFVEFFELIDRLWERMVFQSTVLEIARKFRLRM